MPMLEPEPTPLPPAEPATEDGRRPWWRPAFGSFTSQVAARFAALVVATTALVLVAGGWLLHEQTIHGLENLHAIEFEELCGMIGVTNGLDTETLAHRIKHDTDADAALFYIQIRDQSGALLFRSENLGHLVLPASTEAVNAWTTTLPTMGDVRISEYRLAGWHLQIASPLAPAHQLLKDYTRVAAVLLAVVSLVSIGLGYGFARLTLRPVRAIRETASRISGDNLTERIPVPSGHDELSALVALLNQMFDRLETSFRQLRNFSAVASHELKTPLSLIRINAERLRPLVAADPNAGDMVDEVLEEVSRLHRMIESLLFLTKAESGQLALELKPIDIDALLADFAEDARLLAEDAGAHFVLTRATAGIQRADPNLLRQLFLNLLSNALAVTPPGGTIAVETFTANQRWHLAMTDEGTGLPVDQHYRIFEPFTRYEPPGGATRPPGSGLGLAICRTIAELHGGTIRARNRTDRPGLRVAMALPVRAETVNKPRNSPATE